MSCKDGLDAKMTNGKQGIIYSRKQVNTTHLL